MPVFCVAAKVCFGAIFAFNSALHSYLILLFPDTRRVSLDVGFYYMANAAGRLVGTVLSDATYQFGGLAGCLATAAAVIGLSYLAISLLSVEPSPS